MIEGAKRAVPVGGSSDVVVIGGGAIGCACALEIARRGISTCLLERSTVGTGASSAAAGIISAQSDGHPEGAAFRLWIASRARFARWASDLRDAAGIDVGYRVCGVMRVATDERALAALVRGSAWQRDAGLPVDILEASAVRRVEPAIGEVAGGVRFGDDGRIDPPSLVAALRVAAARAGARIVEGAHVRRVTVDRGRVTGVLLEDGTAVGAGTVVLAAGSWSSLVEGTSFPADLVRPARGQIVELSTTDSPIRGVVFGPECYLVPRDDGRVLVGSTLEHVGFRPGVTAAVVRDLLTAALTLVPALEGAEQTRVWSGFRPQAATELPVVGRTTVQGLIVATGHFKSGILLTPITAEAVAALVVGGEVPAEVAPCAPPP